MSDGVAFFLDFWRGRHGGERGPLTAALQQTVARLFTIINFRGARLLYSELL